jgi:sec-independent protein translocase protein TatA
MPFGIGIWELVILMVLLLLVFGAKRLPEMGRSIGHGMREFKDAVTGKEESESESEPERTELTPPPTPSTQASTTPPAAEQPAETERVSR